MTGDPANRPRRATGRLLMAGVYGATAGTAIGFVYQAVTDVPPEWAVAVWRGFIVTGAVLGIVVKLLIAAFSGSKADSDSS